MKQKFTSQITVVFLMAINLALILQFRTEAKNHQSARNELEITKSELSQNLALFQEAMALSMPAQPLDYELIDLPDHLKTGTFAIRLTDKQCSSCIDYALSEINKYLDETGPAKIMVLYTAENPNSITMGFRQKLLKGIPFIPFPEHSYLTELDQLNLPYLLYMDPSGIRSVYLPFPASNKNIGVYLSHTLTAINQRHEK